jgi:RNA polymerase sigma-70 factor (ECF subfamily)
MSDAPSSAPVSVLSKLPDEDLMVLVANGVIEGPATELFRRHNRALFNFVAWLCQGNAAEAEDITQRAWMKLMTRCADYSPQAAFRTFLFQIARNTWLDVKKSAFEQHKDVFDEAQLQLPADDLTPDAELALRQNLHSVHKAMLALPAQQREVVALRFFSDMSLEEIAHTVGEGFETVKSRLRYAFARLRRELEGASP